MGKQVVIVESPAKARTIKKYLGRDYEVLASYGHVRDLVPKEGAVDPEQGFAMRYRLIEKNEKHVESIAKAVRNADGVLLATDPDREGEAISWHLAEILRERGLLADKPIRRVAFYEITQRAVRAAVEHPREISQDLVNAQQARRALDYLVGFNLSPLLWKKIRRGLSAGRVQSPALRLIVEREEEIERFETREYWTVTADLAQDEARFRARLIQYQGEKQEQFSITTAAQSAEVKKNLERAARGALLVGKIEKKQRRRNPSPPFTTSTLQQEASRQLGFTASRTMRLAQQLYEGVDIGAGNVGLITYMRTDSVNLAAEAVAELREVIGERYGAHNVPTQPPVYKSKAKNAQEAHEAVRPTSARHVPEAVRAHLADDQFRLYELIWKRAMACQMIAATLDTVSAELACGPGNLFRATGSAIADPGFLLVYQEAMDDPAEAEGGLLPPLATGERVPLADILTEQHFTEPPPRYTEASLIKTLEEHGIGRPSTYASIISTLQEREYALLEKRRFKPTDVGRIVNRFLTQHFTQYVDYDFTARLEDELDAISRGEKQWVPVLEDFWRPFKARVEEKTGSLKRSDVTHEALDEACPQCGKPLSIRLGRRGRFVGCGGYPECTYTRNLDGEPGGESTGGAEPVEGRSCPQCEAALVRRQGRYGPFIGCSRYPDCRFIESNRPPPVDTHVPCPKCKQDTLTERRSRYGKVFYSCKRYPDCDYAVWNRPLAESCPQCEWPILTVKTTKRRGTEKVCPQKECGYSAPAPDEAPAEQPATADLPQRATG